MAIGRRGRRGRRVVATVIAIVEGSATVRHRQTMAAIVLATTSTLKTARQGRQVVPHALEVSLRSRLEDTRYCFLKRAQVIRGPLSWIRCTHGDRSTV